MKRIATIVFSIFVVCFSFSQDLSVGGILTGPNWACIVQAPEGRFSPVYSIKKWLSPWQRISD